MIAVVVNAALGWYLWKRVLPPILETKNKNVWGLED